MNRRQLLAALQAATVLSITDLARSRPGPAADRPLLRELFERVDDLGADLRAQRVTPGQWQDRMVEAYRDVDPRALADAIDLERIRGSLQLPDLGVATAPVAAPAPPGGGWRFVRKVFGVAPDRAIIPHGHRNMVSSHFVLDGRFHLRQYDRIDARSDRWVLAPSIDRMAGAGDLSTVSDERDNVHWLIARGGPAWTLDLLLVRLDPSRPTAFEIHNLDMDAARAVGDERLEVPVIDVDQALARYGHTP